MRAREVKRCEKDWQDRDQKGRNDFNEETNGDGCG